MSTITLAKIYEKQGHVAEALEIYRTLVEEDAKNFEAQKAIARMTGVDNTKIVYFTAMATKEQFVSFEKWLGETMELKRLILSTLEELDAKIEEDARRGDMKDIVVAPQTKITVGHEDEEAFLRHSKERFRVLF